VTFPLSADLGDWDPSLTHARTSRKEVLIGSEYRDFQLLVALHRHGPADNLARAPGIISTSTLSVTSRSVGSFPIASAPPFDETSPTAGDNDTDYQNGNFHAYMDPSVLALGSVVCPAISRARLAVRPHLANPETNYPSHRDGHRLAIKLWLGTMVQTFSMFSMSPT
jgi:hypothetical protein